MNKPLFLCGFVLLTCFSCCLSAEEAALSPGTAPVLSESISLSATKGALTAILDGEDVTVWSSNQKAGQEITVDLENPWMVHSVEIKWGERCPTEYEVLLTSDGKTWQTIAHPVDFKRPDQKAVGIKKFAIHKVEPPVRARGIRIRCLKSEKGVAIMDLRINGQYPFCYEPVPPTAVCLDRNAVPEERMKDLLRRMTLREKLGMTVGFNGFFIPEMERFGFAPVLMSDATSGIRLNGREGLAQSTSFPLAAAVAATWQPELAYEMGKAIGEECRQGGTGFLLGPGVNIHRTSTGGRNFEYMGEDPWLAGQMAVGHIRGIQSQKVIAVVKHFIANNNEFVRTRSNAIIDERALHEIYLPAFAAAVEEGNVRAVMSSYNWLNGEKCGEDRTLLTDILRGELGFTGMVMSDWGGTEDPAKVPDSGQNIVMPDMKMLRREILSEWEKNPAEVEKRLDAMIAPTLRVLFEMGAWDRKAADPEFAKTFPAHKATALAIAESAITLLKNDGVLPLAKGQKILVTGSREAVEDASSGAGSGRVQGYDRVNFLQGLQAVFGDDVTYEENPSDETVAKAGRVLYFFKTKDSEGRDHPFDLPEEINSRIAVLAAKNPNTIVIASGGTAFGAPWLDSVKGLVHGYYLGQEYGEAMAGVLSGKVNPSGKLPFTMEKAFTDSPAFGYNTVNGQEVWGERMPPEVQTKTVDIPYKEGVFVGYRWYEAKKKPVNFPFGFGLSYTTFRIHDLKVSADTITKDSPVVVSATVTNTGKVAGAEVVQLYVHEENPSVERPYRELKGFRKVFLQPGESKTVTMPVDWKALAFWDVKTKAWKANPGEFTLLAGNSSRDVQCRGRVVFK